jgi:uncharacterized membrane protein
MQTIAPLLIFVAVLISGGVFGFFYTWSFVVMRGLSLTDAPAAIAAMQSVNANIVTGWFALIFFGTPVATAVAALATYAAGGRGAALWLLAATVIHLVGCFAVTALVNVPMNNALAQVDARSVADPQAAWSGYAGPWTAWNHLRTASCAATLLCAALALWRWPG